MFVESQIEDSIKIYPSSKNIQDSIFEILNQKYKNKYLLEAGLGIYIKKECEVLERRCVEDFVLYKLHFNMIFFRFLRDEVIEGSVCSQNETGIFISILFYDKIHVPLDYLPDNSEVTYIYDEDKNKKLSWVWNYKNNRFIIKTGERVKFKVVEYDEENRRLTGSLNESGLGPVSWWQ